MSPVSLPAMVASAREQVGLYRWLYASAPAVRRAADLGHLPPMTEALLECESIPFTVANLGDICLTRVCEDGHENGRRMPRFLNYSDVIDEYAVLRDIFARARLSATPQRLLLVADAERMYTLGEFGRYVAFYEWPMAALLISAQSVDTCGELAREFCPSVMIADVKNDTLLEPLVRHTRVVVTFNVPTIRLSERRVRHIDIFRHRKVGIAAVMTDGSGLYRYNRRLFHFEVDRGELLVTSLVNRLQPIIRLRLGVAATLVGSCAFKRRDAD